MKIHSVLSRSRLQVAAIASLLALVSGCASRNTISGGKETIVMAGVVTVATESFQPINPATINADTSKMVGKNGPSGDKVTLFWGLLTFHNY